MYDIWALEYKVKCNCPRDTTAVYICLDPECKDYNGFMLYCNFCLIKDKRHILHDAYEIREETENKYGDWEKLVDYFKDLKNDIEKNYPEVETIVKYLENENKLKKDLGVNSPTKKISEDVAEF